MSIEIECKLGNALPLATGRWQC